MTKIHGKDTSLTLLKDNTYTPLCYTEETLRQYVVDHALPATIGGGRRETRLADGTGIEGCFVTRLDADSTLSLFDAVSGGGKLFSLLADRVCTKSIFTFLKAKSLELRAVNGEPFYLRVDVGGTRDSSVERFSHLTPVLRWDNWREREAERQHEDERGSAGHPDSPRGKLRRVCRRQKETFLYNGFSLVEARHDRETLLPLVHRFELAGDFAENRRFTLHLCYALGTELYPELGGIERIFIPISVEHGMYLELEGLRAIDDRAHIRTSGEVLASQRFRVLGGIRFVERNRHRYVRIEL